MSDSASTVAPVEDDALPPVAKPRCETGPACVKRKRAADDGAPFNDDGTEVKRHKPRLPHPRGPFILSRTTSDGIPVYHFPPRRGWLDMSAFDAPELSVDADEIPFDPVTGTSPEPSYFADMPYYYERQSFENSVPEHVRLRREQFREKRQRMREQAQEEDRAARAKRAEELDGHLDDIFKRVAERAEWELQNDAPIVGTAKIPVAFDAKTGRPIWQDTVFNKNQKKIYLGFEDYIRIIDYSLHPHDAHEHPVLDNPMSPIPFALDRD